MPDEITSEAAQSFEAFDLPISQALRHGDTVYVAGQGGIDPETGTVVEGGVVAETHQALRNLDAVLEAAGTSLDKALKVGLYLADMDDMAAVNEVYREYVTEPYPARTAVEVSAFAVDFAVEIDVIAAFE